MPESERRRRPRFLSANLIAYTPEAREGEPTEEEFRAALAGVRTLDLSATGCRIESDRPLGSNAELTFDLELQGALHSFRGRVAWARRVGDAWQAGVDFTDIDDFTRDGIRLYLFESGAEPAAGTEEGAEP